MCSVKEKCLLPLVFSLGMAFFALLGVGLFFPCMDLRMDLELLYSNKPAIKPFAPILEMFHVQEKMHAEVSVWNCTWSLASWALDGEMTSAIAFVMYAVFVVLLTSIDMLVLVFVSLKLASHRAVSCAQVQPLLNASRKLKKLSMLDVSIMGIVVVVMALRSLRAKGVVISMRHGLPFLLAAELCHYGAFHLVMGARSVVTLDQTQQTGAKAENAESNDTV